MYVEGTLLSVSLLTQERMAPYKLVIPCSKLGTFPQGLICIIL